MNDEGYPRGDWLREYLQEVLAQHKDVDRRLNELRDITGNILSTVELLKLRVKVLEDAKERHSERVWELVLKFLGTIGFGLVVLRIIISGHL